MSNKLLALSVVLVWGANFEKGITSWVVMKFMSVLKFEKHRSRASGSQPCLEN